MARAGPYPPPPPPTATYVEPPHPHPVNCASSVFKNIAKSLALPLVKSVFSETFRPNYDPMILCKPRWPSTICSGVLFIYSLLHYFIFEIFVLRTLNVFFFFFGNMGPYRPSLNKIVERTHKTNSPQINLVLEMTSKKVKRVIKFRILELGEFFYYFIIVFYFLFLL